MTDLRTLTPEQVREWLFVKLGGEMLGDQYIWRDGKEVPEWFWPPDGTHNGYLRWGRKPLPPTLDGAAAAMPEGWMWIKGSAGGVVKWCAGNERGIIVDTPCTGHERNDRYLLAALCVQAMEAVKGADHAT